MTLDNSKTIIGFRIKLFGATIVFIAYIILAYFSKTIKFPLLGLSDTAVTLILVAVYILFASLPLILNYQFVFFTDENEKIIFRFFNAGITGGKKNSVEIDKKSFAGYKTETRMFGMIKSIILFQKFQEGVAKYPPIFITALSKEERSKILKSLNSISSAE
jgi:hypothetical protein